MKERIVELDMVKGIFIVSVMLLHTMSCTGVDQLCPEFAKYYGSFILFSMAGFYLLSGYTYSQGKLNVKDTILKKAKSILLPYYYYAIPMLAVLFLVYVLLEKRTMGWFADGLLAVMLQIQSVHIYGDGVGIHEMMYSVFASWFIFQLMAAFVVFIPIYHSIEKRSLYVKLTAAVLLLGMGALFYHLDIQQLNGKFIPPVCKGLILPNIWGVAGLLMLGKCISILGLLNVDRQSAGQKAALFIASLIILSIGLATDDHLYDFPIGKWGGFNELSYFITPVCGLALTLLCVYIANLLKRSDIIKKISLFLGKNSLDFLLVHFFWIWLILYIGGFWYPILSGVELPAAAVDKYLLHFAGAFPLVLALNSIVIVAKEKLR